MIYLDNAATTAPSENAKKAAYDAMENFGNPSSMHRLGITAEKIISNARQNAARVIFANEKNIFFTSGGTEANNTAIIGAAHAAKKRGMHIITTNIEHPSVLSPFSLLEKEGFRVTYLKSDKKGLISPEQLRSALTPDTTLVSVMAVNNEIGSVLPIERLKSIIKEKSPSALFHVDAVQGFGKIPINVKSSGIDLLSASAHKIHGLKGTGLLYISDNAKISPLIVGGGQQRDMRSGTENVVGIAAFSAACYDAITQDNEKVSRLRSMLRERILNDIDRVKINESDPSSQSGYILNVSFLGIKAEILLHSLEMHDIYVSTGSACSSNKPAPSHVLSAVGCSAEEIEGAVRFSFSGDITNDDIDKTVDALKKEVASIRKYTRR